MGASQSRPIVVALQELLFSKGLEVKGSTLERFLSECDAVAPWFAVSGDLTIPCWDKLGRDLKIAREQGKLKAGVRSVWKLVRSCLEDKRECKEAIKRGQAALEKLQEERSESQASESDSELSSSESEDEGVKPLIDEVKWPSLREKREQGRRKLKWRDKQQEPPRAKPTPRPPHHEAKEDVGPRPGHSFCPEVWKEVRREMHLTFPVFVDPQGQRYHEPLDFKTIKSLAESVRTYGITASFTIAQVEALHRHCMTPTDWAQLAKACLSPGQYLDWRAFNIEYAAEQAAANAAAGGGRQAWDRDMILGQGRFAQQQNGYPPEVYEQINNIATRAWKSLPNKGEVTGNLTKIIQGPMEPFSDFIARLVEAAGRIFGDPDTAMPLIKQLAYEQCTKECRAAITPYKGKGLEAWMKVCRELGGPLTNAGLAAAVVQLTNCKEKNTGCCYSCGQPGHLKRNCPKRKNQGQGMKESQRSREPGLCPRCRKGNHWASECRSVKDINGQSLSQGYGGARPKNGQKGPRPQGPQIYGAMEDQEQGWSQERWPLLRHPKSHGEPLKALRDWTSAPPPDLS